MKKQLKFYVHGCLGCGTLLKASYYISDGEVIMDLIDFEFRYYCTCANCRKCFTTIEMERLAEKIEKELENEGNGQ